MFFLYRLACTACDQPERMKRVASHYLWYFLKIHMQCKQSCWYWRFFLLLVFIHRFYFLEICKHSFNVSNLKHLNKLQWSTFRFLMLNLYFALIHARAVYFRKCHRYLIYIVYSAMSRKCDRERRKTWRNFFVLFFFLNQYSKRQNIKERYMQSKRKSFHKNSHRVLCLGAYTSRLMRLHVININYVNFYFPFAKCMD